MDLTELKAAIAAAELSKARMREMLTDVNLAGEGTRSVTTAEVWAFIRASSEHLSAQLNVHDLLLTAMQERIEELERRK